jgi:hypothetical protein
MLCFVLLQNAQRTLHQVIHWGVYFPTALTVLMIDYTITLKIECLADPRKIGPDEWFCLQSVSVHVGVQAPKSVLVG